MLAYRDALVAAVHTRHTAEIERLLAHPLGRVLTREVRNEAQAAAIGTACGVPLKLLLLRHQTSQLLAGRTDAETTAEMLAEMPTEYAPRSSVTVSAGTRRSAPRSQMELPLSA